MVVCTSHLLDQPSISIYPLGVSKTSSPDLPDLILFPHSEGSLPSIVLWDQRPCHSWCLFSLNSLSRLRVWNFFFFLNLQTLSGSIKLSASLWPPSLSSFAWTAQYPPGPLLEALAALSLSPVGVIDVNSRSDHDTLPAKPFKPFVWINLHFTYLIRSAFPRAFKAL